MRIERINFVNLKGLGNVQWTFPEGPVLLLIDRNFQKILRESIVELFYNIKTPPRSKAQSTEGSIEARIVSGNTHYHICRDFFKQEGDHEYTSTLMIKDQDGRNVSLPDSMALGEYLFQAKLNAFRQGGLVEWPEDNESDFFVQRVRNLRQAGDEDLSLETVRASLAGAQKKVKDQKESMMLVKAEYDTLRKEWEAAHRLLDEERLLQIEIKNLQEKERILAEKIDWSTKILERLTVLGQNPDYRELRQLKGELTRLEERYHELDLNLKSLTLDSQVDLTLIDSLREECMEWAFLQEQVELIAAEAKRQSRKIEEIQDILDLSGYHGFSEGEDERLLRMEEQKNKAQEELDKIVSLKSELITLQKSYSIESTRLQDLAIMAEVTDADEIKIALREKHLRQWQSLKIGSWIDRMVKKRLGWRSISEMLSSWLIHYYKSYQTANNQEFINKLERYRDQRILVEKILMELKQLQENVSLEEKCQRIVYTRDEVLKKAFAVTKVKDLSAWLRGWEDYRHQKYGLAKEFDELHQIQERLSMAEQTVAACAQQLRDKLESWGNTTTDRDEVLTAVLKVASQLRAREEAEKEFTVFLLRFQVLLGTRNLEHLAMIIEPMAELERESRLPNKERLTKLAVWQNDRVETSRLLATAEQRLKSMQKSPSLAVLEKKLEPVKRQWTAYENLHHALNDAQVLLEVSWQEWQIKYGKPLNEEMQWILNRISSSESKVSLKNDLLDAKRNYFSYRMAVAQLALRNNTEAPLFFSVGERNEEERFWKGVLEFLSKISVSRQVVFCTTDPILLEQLSEKGWQYCISE